MKLGFIGVGNMGGAIFKGFVKNNAVKPENIYLYDLNSSILEKYKDDFNVNISKSYDDLLSKTDAILLAVKPNVFSSVLSDISKYIKQYKPLILSIAAGITIESIEDMLGFNTSVIRIMPNINAEICESTTALCKNSLVSEKQFNEIKNCFNAIGHAIEIDEKQFAIFAAIAGCSPAYVYMFIDALAKGALKAGMNKKQAIEIAASAVYGSAKMILESGLHPKELADKVCSPGGTTIEGVCTLDDYKFETGIVKAVENSIKKDYELNKKNN